MLMTAALIGARGCGGNPCPPKKKYFKKNKKTSDKDYIKYVLVIMCWEITLCPPPTLIFSGHATELYADQGPFQGSTNTKTSHCGL